MGPVDDWVDVGQPVPIQAQTQSPILSAPSDEWVDTSKPTRVPFTYMPAKPEDFKFTPPSVPPPPKPSTARNVTSLINPADNMLGFAKGAAGTAYNIYKGVANAVQGKPAETIRDPNIESALQTQTWGEQAGKLEENAGEYMAGEGALTGAARAATGATKVPRVLSVVGRAAAGATSAAAVQKAQGGSNTDTAIAAVGGGVLGPLIEGTAAGAKWLGLKFQARAVGLSAKDVARGASRASEAPLAMIDRLNTYGVARPTLGGTLDATQQKITSLASDLRTQLRASNAGEAIQPSAQGAAANVFDASTRVTTQPALPGAGVGGGATVANTAAQRAAGAAAHRAEVIEAIKAGREIPEDVAQQYPDLANAIHLSKIPGPKVDLASAVDRAEAAISANATHMTPVEMQQAKAAIAQYRAHYANLEHGPIVPLDDAQNAKRAAGLAGAWEYGKQAGDRGMERVSNLIFGYLRGDIETVAATAGVDVQAINKQLSDLMPLEQAMVRRVPVEARQQVLTLTDWMLVATGHPVEAAARVGGKMFGMGVGAGLVKGASGMRTASRPLTASVLDILNAKNDYQQQHNTLTNIIRGNPTGTEGGTYPRRTGSEVEFPLHGERDENDAMFMHRTRPDGAPRQFPVAVPPSTLLPEHFKNARAVIYGAPLPGTVPKDFRGLYGLEFERAARAKQAADNQNSPDNPTHIANTISIGREGTDEPGTWAHEVNHAVYQKDLTPEQRAAFGQMVMSAITSAVKARQTGGAAAEQQVIATIPKAVIAFANQYPDKRERGLNEMFAELGAQYMLNPRAFSAKYPQWYGLFKQFYRGKEYK